MLRRLLLITSLCLMANGTAQPLFSPLNTKCRPVPPEKACRYVTINASLLLENGRPIPFSKLPPISLNVWSSTAHEVAYWNVVLQSNGMYGDAIPIPGGWKWLGGYAGNVNSAFWLVYRNGVWSGTFATDAVEYRITQVRGVLRVAQFKPPVAGQLPYLMVPLSGGSAPGGAP